MRRDPPFCEACGQARRDDGIIPHHAACPYGRARVAMVDEPPALADLVAEIRASTLRIVAETIDEIADDFARDAAAHTPFTGSDVAARLRRTSNLIRNTKEASA